LSQRRRGEPRAEEDRVDSTRAWLMAASPRSATDSEGDGSERWQATPLDLMAALYAGFPGNLLISLTFSFNIRP
jgi:hypothetical protein